MHKLSGLAFAAAAAAVLAGGCAHDHEARGTNTASRETGNGTYNSVGVNTNEPALPPNPNDPRTTPAPQTSEPAPEPPTPRLGQPPSSTPDPSVPESAPVAPR